MLLTFSILCMLGDLCLYAQTTIFLANFESTSGDNNWTITNSNVNDGAFVIGVPQAYVSNSTQMEIAAFEGAQALLTGNRVDANGEDLDGGPTTAISPLIALPAGGVATLSMAYYFAWSGTDATEDYLIIDILDTGNNVLETLVSINGTTTNTPAAYSTLSVDVTPYVGQSIRIRAQAADVGSGSKIEVALDLVEITHFPQDIISGTVFHDENHNGLLDPGEIGIGSVTIDIYSQGVLVSSAITDAQGQYTISGLVEGQDYRVRYANWPTQWIASLIGSDNGGPLQYVTVPAVSNLGLYDPTDCSDPYIVVPCYVEGELSTLPATEPAIVKLPSSAEGHDFSGTNYTANFQVRMTANYPQVGTTYGIAWQPDYHTYYAGAYHKRYSDYGPQGSAGLYQLGLDGSFIGSISLDALTSANVAGADVHDWAFVNGELYDQGANDESIDGVGKRSLGDIELSEDQSTLYVMNLFDRTIYALDVSGGSLSAATLVNSWSVVDPTGGGRHRPFGMAWHDGLLWVGITDENGQNGWVYSLDVSNGTFTPQLTIPLTYARQSYIANADNAPTLSNWRAWATDANINYVDLNNEIAYPQAIISDIEFSATGDMIIGLRDRFGDQSGPGRPFNTASATYKWPISAGDLLFACYNGSGFDLESGIAGSCPTTGGGLNNSGPGGEEYYYWDIFEEGTATWDPSVRTGALHWETTQGGLVNLDNQDQIITTAMDPIDDFSGGVLKFNNVDGSRVNTGATSTASNLGGGYTIFESGDYSGSLPPNLGTAAKANGLGDLELACVPTIIIGNYVWLDLNKDGVQQEGEPPLANVTVELFDGPTLIGSTVTDTNGYYVFGGADGINMLNDQVLQAYSAYTVQILMTSAAANDGSQTDISKVTLTDVGSDELDNDATESGGVASIAFATGDLGTTDYHLDFGFQQCPVSSVSQEFEVMSGDGFTVQVGNSIYSEENTFGMDTLVNAQGCDSIVTTTIIIPNNCDTISQVGFEGDTYGIWTDRGSTASVNSSAGFAHTGSTFLLLYGFSNTGYMNTQALDLSNADSTTIDFWIRGNALEFGDGVELYYSIDNGSSWILWETYLYNQDIDLNAYTNYQAHLLGPLGTQTKFRFLTLGNETEDNILLDDIVISYCDLPAYCPIASPLHDTIIDCVTQIDTLYFATDAEALEPITSYTWSEVGSSTIFDIFQADQDTVGIAIDLGANPMADTLTLKLAVSTATCTTLDTFVLTMLDNCPCLSVTAIDTVMDCAMTNGIPLWSVDTGAILSYSWTDLGDGLGYQLVDTDQDTAQLILDPASGPLAQSIDILKTVSGELCTRMDTLTVTFTQACDCPRVTLADTTVLCNMIGDTASITADIVGYPVAHLWEDLTLGTGYTLMDIDSQTMRVGYGLGQGTISDSIQVVHTATSINCSETDTMWIQFDQTSCVCPSVVVQDTLIDCSVAVDTIFLSGIVLGASGSTWSDLGSGLGYDLFDLDQDAIKLVLHETEGLLPASIQLVQSVSNAACTVSDTMTVSFGSSCGCPVPTVTDMEVSCSAVSGVVNVVGGYDGYAIGHTWETLTPEIGFSLVHADQQTAGLSYDFQLAPLPDSITLVYTPSSETCSVSDTIQVTFDGSCICPTLILSDTFWTCSGVLDTLYLTGEQTGEISSYSWEAIDPIVGYQVLDLNQDTAIMVVDPATGILPSSVRMKKAVSTAVCTLVDTLEVTFDPLCSCPLVLQMDTMMSCASQLLPMEITGSFVGAGVISHSWTDLGNGAGYILTDTSQPTVSLISQLAAGELGDSIHLLYTVTTSACSHSDTISVFLENNCPIDPATLVDTFFCADFETTVGDNAWVTIQDANGTGSWEINVPDPYAPFFSSDIEIEAYQGSQTLLTERGDGDIDGVTIVRSPDIYLPQTSVFAAYEGYIELTFQWYFAYAELAGAFDAFSFDIKRSSDGQLLDRIIQEYGDLSGRGASWVAFSELITQYAGQEVYFELTATEEGGSTKAEAAVDLVCLTYHIPSVIFGEVYYDEDQDGMYDLSEQLLENVKVKLYQDGVLLDSAWTDNQGLYVFDSLPIGVYHIEYYDWATQYEPSIITDDNLGPSHVAEPRGEPYRFGVTDPIPSYACVDTTVSNVVTMFPGFEYIVQVGNSIYDAVSNTSGIDTLATFEGCDSIVITNIVMGDPCMINTQDDFEVGLGNWSIIGPTAQYNLDSSYAFNSSGSLRLTGPAATGYAESPVIDASAADDLSISFVLLTDGYDMGDQVVIDYSSNGGSNWSNLVTYTFGTNFSQNNVFYKVTQMVNATLTSDMKFRLVTGTTTDSSDNVYFDDVVIETCITPTFTCPSGDARDFYVECLEGIDTVYVLGLVGDGGSHSWTDNGISDGYSLFDTDQQVLGIVVDLARMPAYIDVSHTNNGNNCSFTEDVRVRFRFAPVCEIIASEDSLCSYRPIVLENLPAYSDIPDRHYAFIGNGFGEDNHTSQIDNVQDPSSVKVTLEFERIDDHLEPIYVNGRQVVSQLEQLELQNDIGMVNQWDINENGLPRFIVEITSENVRLYASLTKESVSMVEIFPPTNVVTLTPKPFQMGDNTVTAGIGNNTGPGYGNWMVLTETDDGYTYLWSTGDTTNQITSFPVGPEVYTLEVSSPAGCKSTCTKEISIGEIFIDSTSYTYIGCQDDGYGIVIDGTVYNESNPTDTIVYSSANSCDSIVIVNLQFFSPVEVEAGASPTICSNGVLELQNIGASISGGGISTGQWTTSGDGTFDNGGLFGTANSATSYTPGPLETAQGYLIITLTSDDPSSSCEPRADAIMVLIKDVSCREFPWAGGN